METTVLISVSDAFADWVGLDLPQLRGPDGLRADKQPLQTAGDIIAWQCHVVHPYEDERAVVIAVEAFSRYTILIPSEGPPTQAGFEGLLSRRWLHELVQMMLDNGIVDEEGMAHFIQQFAVTHKAYRWAKNTDPALVKQVKEAEYWLNQGVEQYGVIDYDEAECFGLGIFLNEMEKKQAKALGGAGSFQSIPRFIDDGRWRFSRDQYPDIQDPYTPSAAGGAVSGEQSGPPPDNVVSLAQFRKRKERPE